MLPLCRFGTDDELLQHAQRRYSSVIHHTAWLKHLLCVQSVGKREAIRFVAASQPYAGTFLNPVPKYKPFRMPTWGLWPS